MPRRRQRMVEVKIRLYPGQDDELLRWLEQLDEQPFGAKTQALKDALLRGIGANLEPGLAAAPVIDLAEVRRVVEAAVATALGRFEGGIARMSVVAPEEDDETEDLLDTLEATLVLADDEA